MLWWNYIVHLGEGGDNLPRREEKSVYACQYLAILFLLSVLRYNLLNLSGKKERNQFSYTIITIILSIENTCVLVKFSSGY